MEPVYCKACDHEIDRREKRCPHCGVLYPANPSWNGWGVDWRTRATLAGWPLVHVSFGRDMYGHWRVAKGIIAIGQFGFGLITIAQFGVGLLFGFGQALLGMTGIAQFAITAYFALGQIAVGNIAIGQVVLGRYGLGQVGLAEHLWSATVKDPAAVAFFKPWIAWLGF